MKLRYKARALRDIEGIHSYIARDSVLVARRLVARIEHSISRLAAHPFSGRAGVVAGTRMVVVPGLPYVAIYRVRGEVVDVIAVLHTARRRRN